MKAVLNTYLHLDWFINKARFFYRVVYYELLFFSDSIVVAVNNHVNKVAQANNNAIIALKLFLYTIEREGILARICENSSWLKLLSEVNEISGLILVEEVLDDSDELNSDAKMIDL